ncbi:MAG: bifunctional (p)ppGpp synthetase/guanosine-3',5'-bis(diphosphate) 3'-pyrophosphohydrolase [Bacteroidales bacterium]|nr:bifunctional (p)ppGpp synthetase/guanosine-3',5'-bis(diphosphate) 3'-pyrophosphohydrolase [Bacteroidales bacterium]MBQ4168685.1 bifunctional (p)ppGpp synthetase/guanosine-3',5'-bis(diphosphate) 3'-pyrophosphohydrolase [Bacteroidales bacterium]
MERLLQRAREVAAKALAGDVRGNGAPMYEHASAVARIVADEIGLPETCIAAVYLHEATRFHPEVDISEFPEDVKILVDGLNKIAGIRPKDTRLEAENYKKLIVQYSRDPRVTVLKIADRLEVMRSLSIFSKQSRERIILETLMLYIPLAHQLGLYNIKREMEDIYFNYAEPEQYKEISRKLKATEKDRIRLTAEFIRPLEDKLRKAGIEYKLKVRTKAAYSIYKKMQVQKVPFEGVYDVFAIRFIIDCDPEDHALEKELCWNVYSYVTEEYEADTSRLRDWITNPKPNGYESLHITVKNAQGAYLEVQIRTKRMDAEAENGQAAHWSYKGIKHEQALDTWLKSVRYNLEHKFDTKSEDLPSPPSSEVFVFTPTGELRILPAGASVLDFAFNIHTGLGCKCTGGRINGKAVSIKEKLHTGDVVEIMSSKSQKPNADWLGYVVTAKARSKIKVELDAELRSQAAQGRELLQRRLKNWKLTLGDDQVADMMHYLKFSSVISFMAAIGRGEIDVNDIKTYIQNPDLLVLRTNEKEEKKAVKEEWSPSNEIMVINAKGVKGLEYKMAACCNPQYGDDVFGFVTRTAGIKIHRSDCPNAPRMKELYPYRIQKVVWQEKSVPATIKKKK